MNNSSKQANTKLSIQCFHCGNDCNDDQYNFDEKEFCCIGCQSVYQILTGITPKERAKMTYKTLVLVSKTSPVNKPKLNFS